MKSVATNQTNGACEIRPESGAAWAEELRRGELRESVAAATIARLYRWSRIRRRVIASIIRLEGGPFWSATARRLLARYHGVSVGAYSYGPCLTPGEFPPGVVVGRYVSVAAGVRVFTRNHPMERLSLHPFFYNSRLGMVETDTIGSGTLVIGHDAWLGERCIVTPGCRSIGVGAVVGAGSVVTRDVPDFAIVAGSPARVIRFRFDAEMRRSILASRWWDAAHWELKEVVADMVRPLDSSHPLLNRVRRSIP